jgi:hypothetical protein
MKALNGELGIKLWGESTIVRIYGTKIILNEPVGSTCQNDLK